MFVWKMLLQLLDDLMSNIVLLKSILIKRTLSCRRNDSRISINGAKGLGHIYTSDDDLFLELLNTCSKKSMGPYNFWTASFLMMNTLGVPEVLLDYRLNSG